MKTLYAKSAETTAPSVTKYGRRSITELGKYSTFLARSTWWTFIVDKHL